MLKLILAAIIAALIAGGVYAYQQFNEGTESAEQTGSQIDSSLDAIEGANDAIQQQTDRADDIQQKAQDIDQSPYDY
jgi:hypothetical protein